MQKIDIQATFPFSVEKLFNYLKQHENFQVLFAPAKVKTIQEGNNGRYDIGSVRRISAFPVPPFEETIVHYEKNKVIEYKITKGTPLKNHHGKMIFSSHDKGSKLHYTIEFESNIPLVALIVKIALEKKLREGLNALKKKSL
jgi:hypothetical protein